MHCRQQLSAMLDGELAPDEARFLLRRLQHDRELGGCWERWQICGDLLRGSVQTVLPADFSRRVTDAIDNAASGDAVAIGHAARAQAVPARTTPRYWLHWGGGAALAASVAAVALLVGRSGLLPGNGSNATPVVATSTQQAMSDVQTRVAGDAIALQPTAGALASSSDKPAVAVGADPHDVALSSADNMHDIDASSRRLAIAAERNPVRARSARTSSETRHAAARAPVSPVADTAPAETALAETATQPVLRHDLFDGQIQQERPWPRALVPGAGHSGLNAGYGTLEPATDPLRAQMQWSGAMPAGQAADATAEHPAQ